MAKEISWVKEKLEEIIDSARKLDFPAFSYLERKHILLQEERAKVDRQVDVVLEQAGLPRGAGTDDSRDALWRQADAEARAEFGSLPEKEMMNGFYLQEVIHRYAALLADAAVKEMEE